MTGSMKIDFNKLELFWANNARLMSGPVTRPEVEYVLTLIAQREVFEPVARCGEVLEEIKDLGLMEECDYPPFVKLSKEGHAYRRGAA